MLIIFYFQLNLMSIELLMLLERHKIKLKIKCDRIPYKAFTMG